MPAEKNEVPNNVHNVFISWCGERSQHAAKALRDWLPMVIQAVKPFMSKKDIDKGARWAAELATALEGTKVGIVCLTQENLAAPWLLFESGALSKTLDRVTRVFTYLLGGLNPGDVAQPLAQFQATKADVDETRQMLRDMNKALGSPITEQTVDGVFTAMWPTLEQKLNSMPPAPANAPPKRGMPDMVEEILELVRAAAKERPRVRIEAFEKAARGD